MARTKQTARRSNTGMIPRKALARKSTRRMAAVSGPIFSEEDEADEFEVVDNFEGIEEGSSKNNGSGGLSDTNSIEAHRAVIKNWSFCILVPGHDVEVIMDSIGLNVPTESK